MSRFRRALRDFAAAATVGSGMHVYVGWRRRRRGDHRLFILGFHDVTAGAEGGGAISARRFTQHLRYLKAHFRMIALPEAIRLLQGREPLTEDLVAITFDDGYAGNYEVAWPLLAAEHVPATIFVTTGFVDGGGLWFDRARRCLAAAQQLGPFPAAVRCDLQAVVGKWPASIEACISALKRLPRAPRDGILRTLEEVCSPLAPPARALRWEQLRELQAAGLTIGCHTVSHPVLSTLPPEQQRAEITGARARIAVELGVAPELFAYPNGTATDFTPTTAALVQHAGFVAACTTLRGSNRSGCDVFTLKRIGVGAEPCWVLAARLAGVFDEAVRRWLPRTAAA